MAAMSRSAVTLRSNSFPLSGVLLTEWGGIFMIISCSDDQRGLLLRSGPLLLRVRE
jgi:hypothetical protein